MRQKLTLEGAFKSHRGQKLTLEGALQDIC